MSQLSHKLYTAAQVRQLDAAAIEGHGIPGYELMCRAGKAIAEAARQSFPGSRHWLVLCGAGNNGGDGYVVARLARAAGLRVTVIAMNSPDRLAGDAARAATDWLEADGQIDTWPRDLDEGVDLVVDALLGTGLDREVGGPYRDAIELANAMDVPRVAVDIPSGLHADTGVVMGVAFNADLTVSFIGQKRGLYTADGPEVAGEVLFDELDTPASIHAEVGIAGERLGHGFLRGCLSRRLRNSHKGSYGHVLVVAGNTGMSGAARLTGEAALRSGAGLLSVATHPVHAHWLNLSRPELMVTAAAEPADLEPLLQRATVLAAGPGLGADSWAQQLLEASLEAGQAQGLPMVLDADALNLLAGQSPGERYWPAANAVLTPHPAEAARLLEIDTPAVQADRVGAAEQLAAQSGAVVVLKGCGTVVAAPDGHWAICALGNPGMATAGSGDVLTGVIAAMLAQGFDAWTAACLGVTAHAAAGDEAALAGERGMLASDISACLPGVVND